MIFDPHKGAVDFSGGQQVELSASDTIVRGNDFNAREADPDELEQIVPGHLKCFTVRENLTFDWGQEV